MKKAMIIMTVFILLSTALYAYDPVAVIRSAEGKVEIRSSSDTWTPVSSGMYLPVGATISTGFESRATLELGGCILEVEPLTRMRIDELAAAGDTVHTELFLEVGKVRSEVNSVEGLQNDFTLRSPVTTASVRGTAFTFDTMNLRTEREMVALANRTGQSIHVWENESGKDTGRGLPEGGLARREQIVFITLYTTDISGPQSRSGLTPSRPPVGIGTGTGVGTGTGTGISGPGTRSRPPLRYGTVTVGWTYLD